MNYDPVAPRVPYAMPASHKGYSAYSREAYTGGELDYRGKTAPCRHCRGTKQSPYQMSDSDQHCKTCAKETV